MFSNVYLSGLHSGGGVAVFLTRIVVSTIRIVVVTPGVVAFVTRIVVVVVGMGVVVVVVVVVVGAGVVVVVVVVLVLVVVGVTGGSIIGACVAPSAGVLIETHSDESQCSALSKHWHFWQPLVTTPPG